MYVLHAHWRPPRRMAEMGGMLFWAETSEASQPAYLRGRLPKKHPPKEHPFCLRSEILQKQIGAGTPLADASTEVVKVLLPTTRTGPIPSPELGHNWHIDTETPYFLAPSIINGLWLSPSKAFGVLVNLPDESKDAGFMLGTDARYWCSAANLVLEVLASQKIVPVLSPVKGNGHFHARWQPVMDGPDDGARLARLASAMPPICNMELLHPNGRYHTGVKRTSAKMLDSFLNVMCDALIRSWGKSAAPYITTEDDGPFYAWLQALFEEDPAVKASAAQLGALNSNLHAWMRNLRASGDAVFRIAFRLEAPEGDSVLTNNGDQRPWQMHYMLQARDDPTLLIPAEEIWRSNGKALQQMGRRFEKPQEKLLAGLGYAARLFPPLLNGLQTSQPTGVTLDTDQAYAFLREAAPLLEQAGFALLVPPWWNKRSARLGVRLRLRPKQDMEAISLARGTLSLDNLIEYQWELSLGDTTITRQEFEALAAMKQALVQIHGKWIQLDVEQIEAATRFWDKKDQSGTMNLLKAAQFGLSGEEGYEIDDDELPLTEVVAEDWLDDWLKRLSSHDQITELPQPIGMQGELRPYQRLGYSWLAFLRRWNLGACLADDMGLGKTIQTLALLLHEKEKYGSLPGPVLLVCPTSVVTNWDREKRRFAPELTTMIHQGPNRLRNSKFTDAAPETDLILTSYAVARQDAELLKSVDWFGVILDEAQNIKNPSAKQTQAVRALSSSFRIALTGTPVENRLHELWSIMHFLNPGYLGPQQNFRRDFSIPIERFGNKRATRRLKNLVDPFILRRVKSDPRVIQDLPDKIERKEYCYLSEEQATLYEAIVNDVMQKVNDSDGMERKGLILKLLLQLKQICNHPAQYMHQVEAVTNDRSQIPGRSGKLGRLVEMLEEIMSSDDKVLIFTQFAEMGKLLSAYLPHALGRGVQFLYGETPARQREQMVRRFQEEDSGPPILILSLKAGGTGLNLARASHVFHFDRWWNPAVENQATDRAYRIGQTRNVQVHKFITAGTLEERIDEMIESKKGLAEAIIGSGEQWLTELSTDDLRKIIELRR